MGHASDGDLVTYPGVAESQMTYPAAGSNFEATIRSLFATELATRAQNETMTISVAVGPLGLGVDPFGTPNFVIS